MSAVSPARLLKWKHSPSLLFAAINTFCSVVFQLGALYKLGVGARSDLYYASIIIPTLLYSLAFGALNNVLVPMFVEARARGNGEEFVLLWNCIAITVVGGLALLALVFFPVLLVFPLLFRKLAWVDLHQVGGVLLAFSLYQVLYIGVTTKSCFLFARGRPVLAQAGIFCGWMASLCLLVGFPAGGNLAGIPICLVAGSAVALLFPNLAAEAFFYRKGLFKYQALSLISRTLPITAGTSVTWLEPSIDGVIASTLKQGSLTIYYFFAKALLYIATAISSGYIQPVTKHLAELAGSGRWSGLQRRTNSVALRAAIIGLGLWLCTLVVFLLIGLLNISFLRVYVSGFKRSFPVFLLLLGYLFGMLAYAVYSNALYIMRRERLFLFASVVTFAPGIILKLLGARTLGLQGLALGTSIYWISWAALLTACFWWAVGHTQGSAHSVSSSPSYGEDAVELLK
jgi:peptidoglycan biosynthesis protein MviN/MurJ (putative lipid II flippase)